MASTAENPTDSDSNPTTSLYTRQVRVTYAYAGTKPPIYIFGSFTTPPWEPQKMEFTVKSKEASKVGEEAESEYEFYKIFQVEEGQWEYKFRIGDADWWALDEEAPTTTDESGNRNNLLVVGGERTAYATEHTSIETTTPMRPDETPAAELFPTPTTHTNGKDEKEEPPTGSDLPKPKSPGDSGLDGAHIEEELSSLPVKLSEPDIIPPQEELTVLKERDKVVPLEVENKTNLVLPGHEHKGGELVGVQVGFEEDGSHKPIIEEEMASPEQIDAAKDSDDVHTEPTSTSQEKEEPSQKAADLSAVEAAMPELHPTVLAVKEKAPKDIAEEGDRVTEQHEPASVGNDDEAPAHVSSTAVPVEPAAEESKPHTTSEEIALVEESEPHVASEEPVLVHEPELRAALEEIISVEESEPHVTSEEPVPVHEPELHAASEEPIPAKDLEAHSALEEETPAAEPHEISDPEPVQEPELHTSTEELISAKEPQLHAPSEEPVPIQAPEQHATSEEQVLAGVPEPYPASEEPVLAQVPGPHTALEEPVHVQQSEAHAILDESVLVQTQEPDATPEGLVTVQETDATSDEPVPVPEPELHAVSEEPVILQAPKPHPSTDEPVSSQEPEALATSDAPLLVPEHPADPHDLKAESAPATELVNEEIPPERKPTSESLEHIPKDKDPPPPNDETLESGEEQPQGESLTKSVETEPVNVDDLPEALLSPSFKEQKGSAVTSEDEIFPIPPVDEHIDGSTEVYHVTNELALTEDPAAAKGPVSIEVPDITEEIPIPFTFVEKVPDIGQPVYGDSADDQSSLHEDAENHQADAEPDQVVEPPKLPPSEERVGEAPEHSSVPTLVVEKTDNEPSFGDDFGTEGTHAQRSAHEKRAADAEPDEVLISPEHEEQAREARKEHEGLDDLPEPETVPEDVGHLTLIPGTEPPDLEPNAYPPSTDENPKQQEEPGAEPSTIEEGAVRSLEGENDDDAGASTDVAIPEIVKESQTEADVPSEESAPPVAVGHKVAVEEELATEVPIEPSSSEDTSHGDNADKTDVKDKSSDGLSIGEIAAGATALAGAAATTAATSVKDAITAPTRSSGGAPEEIIDAKSTEEEPVQMPDVGTEISGVGESRDGDDSKSLEAAKTEVSDESSIRVSVPDAVTGAISPAREDAVTAETSAKDAIPESTEPEPVKEVGTTDAPEVQDKSLKEDDAREEDDSNTLESRKAEAQKGPSDSLSVNEAAASAAAIAGGAAVAAATIVGHAVAKPVGSERESTEEPLVSKSAEGGNLNGTSEVDEELSKTEPAAKEETASVPDVVKDSISVAHSGPEAVANPEAVHAKEAVEHELLKEAEPVDDFSEPALAATAAVVESVPAATSSEPSAPLQEAAATETEVLHTPVQSGGPESVAESGAEKDILADSKADAVEETPSALSPGVAETAAEVADSAATIDNPSAPVPGIATTAETAVDVADSAAIIDKPSIPIPEAAETAAEVPDSASNIDKPSTPIPEIVETAETAGGVADSAAIFDKPSTPIPEVVEAATEVAGSSADVDTQPTSAPAIVEATKAAADAADSADIVDKPSTPIPEIVGTAAVIDEPSTQVSEVAETAAEVADSAAIVDKPSTPIPEVAQTAAEAADSTAPLDKPSTPIPEVAAIADVNGDVSAKPSPTSAFAAAVGHHSEHDSPRVEDAPLFTHEYLEPCEEQPVSPNGRSEPSSGLKHETPLEPEEPSALDLADPMLETFPSERQEVLEQLRTTEARLEEDETSVEGIPPSPVLNPNRQSSDYMARRSPSPLVERSPVLDAIPEESAPSSISKSTLLPESAAGKPDNDNNFAIPIAVAGTSAVIAGVTAAAIAHESSGKAVEGDSQGHLEPLPSVDTTVPAAPLPVEEDLPTRTEIDVHERSLSSPPVIEQSTDDAHDASTADSAMPTSSSTAVPASSLSEESSTEPPPTGVPHQVVPSLVELGEVDKALERTGLEPTLMDTKDQPDSNDVTDHQTSPTKASEAQELPVPPEDDKPESHAAPGEPTAVQEPEPHAGPDEPVSVQEQKPHTAPAEPTSAQEPESVQEPEPHPAAEEPVYVQELEAHTVLEEPASVQELEARPAPEEPVSVQEPEAHATPEEPVFVQEPEPRPAPEEPVSVQEPEAHTAPDEPVSEQEPDAHATSEEPVSAQAPELHAAIEASSHAEEHPAQTAGQEEVAVPAAEAAKDEAVPETHSTQAVAQEETTPLNTKEDGISGKEIAGAIAGVDALVGGVALAAASSGKETTSSVSDGFSKAVEEPYLGDSAATLHGKSTAKDIQEENEPAVAIPAVSNATEDSEPVSDKASVPAVASIDSAEAEGSTAKQGQANGTSVHVEEPAESGLRQRKVATDTPERPRTPHSVQSIKGPKHTNIFKAFWQTVFNGWVGDFFSKVFGKRNRA